MNEKEKDLARVVSQPLSETAELPQRPTENVPSTAPEKKLLATMDGMAWATEFCRITGFKDEGWALAWFCNAIMTGFDEANRRRDVEIREFVGWLSADIAELHAVEVPRLAESLERFNRR